jgi:hypothetical protein
MNETHGSWIKIFKDKSKEYGSDLDIINKNASWSAGKQRDIAEVFLSDGVCSLSFSVPDTEWFQFDRYLAYLSFGTNSSVRTHRVVQAKIKENHIDCFLAASLKDTYFCWAVLDKDKDNEHDYIYQIKENDIGKWITISLVNRKSVSVSFATKGKM